MSVLHVPFGSSNAIFAFDVIVLLVQKLLMKDEWNIVLTFVVLVQVQACGTLVTEEQPQSMLVPIELFLMYYSFYQRPMSLSSSPTSPLSPPCVPPELLSSESLGLKLKPIKTRVALLESH
jgi:hypothetical protein